MLQGKFSMKLSRVSDPKSWPEIWKRNKMIAFKMVAVLGILLVLSYGAQFVSFVFALGIGSVTVRGLLTIIVGSFCFYHREEMIKIVLENQAVIKDKLGFFKGLDELETGMQKIKYLQARSKIKQAKIKARKKMAMRL